MVQFVCPNCGSKYFLASRTGPKNVFNIVGDRAVEFVMLASDTVEDINLDTQNIYCGACAWQGGIDEVVESYINC